MSAFDEIELGNFLTMNDVRCCQRSTKVGKAGDPLLGSGFRVNVAGSGKSEPTYLKSSAANIIVAVPSVTQIGSLIERREGVHGGRPCIAGTSVSVRRIATWYNQGLVPEEIVRKFGHISLAQVHAALAYYHANREEIEADLESEARAIESLAPTEN